jgi:hypothetical protein
MRSMATRELVRNDQGMTGRTAAAVEQRFDDLLDRMILPGKAELSLQIMIVVGSADLAERNSIFGVDSAEHISGNNFEYDPN